jgi:hypothetical protein
VGTLVFMLVCQGLITVFAASYCAYDPTLAILKAPPAAYGEMH